MTFEIALVFAILIGALIVFILDRFPIDFVAFSIMALMLVLGPILGLKPEEAISGFSNPATITVMAMFILSAGIYHTGVVIIAALGAPILITAIAGGVLMVLTGCLRMHELHGSIGWDVIFLLAGVIPLGLAMQRAGAVQLLADLAARSADYLPPPVWRVIYLERIQLHRLRPRDHFWRRGAGPPG